MFVEVKNKLDSHHKVVINLHGLACSIKEVGYINISIDAQNSIFYTFHLNSCRKSLESLQKYCNQDLVLNCHFSMKSVIITRSRNKLLTSMARLPSQKIMSRSKSTVSYFSRSQTHTKQVMPLTTQ